MGRFTKHNVDMIDFQIQSQLDLIVYAIVDILQKNVVAIILGGGFGKGEGSIKFVGERVLPFRDYDILVVVKKIPNDETLSRVYQQIYKNTGVKSRLHRFSDFVVDLIMTTRNGIKSFPDIFSYEIKVASQLLYGEDVRKEIPWEIKDIPLSSGWRFLFEKITALIGHFPQQYITEGQIDQHKQELLIYECYKTYMEIATTLTLLMGCYEPSFSARAEAFKSNYYRKLPSLYEILPELPATVEKTTQFKLNPVFEKLNENSLDLWFKTRDDLITVAKFYLNKYLTLNITDFNQSEQALVYGLHNNYFKSQAKAICNISLKTNNTFDIAATNAYLQLSHNLYYISNFGKNRKIAVKVLRYPFNSVTVRLHAIAPQVILSIQRDGCVDLLNFESAKRSLLSLLPYAQITSFEDLKTAYLVGYRHLWTH
jgi:hypothetical protein